MKAIDEYVSTRIHALKKTTKARTRVKECSRDAGDSSYLLNP